MAATPTPNDLLGTAANVLQVLSWLGLPTLSAILGGMVAWLWRDRALQRKSRDALLESVTALGHQIKHLESRLETMSERDPVSWMARFRDISDHDEATRWLRERLELTAEPLGDTFLALAKRYNLLYPGGESAYLAEAYRCARMAALLMPAHDEARELLQELDIATSFLRHATGTFDPDVKSDLPLVHERVMREHVESYLRHLLALAIEKVQAGEQPAYEIVTRQARRVGMALLPVNNALMLNARQLWAESLYMGGLFDRALAEIEEIEPALQHTLRPGEQQLHELQLMKALIKTAMGDASELAVLASAAGAMGIPVGTPGQAPRDVEIPEDIQQAIRKKVEAHAKQPFVVSLDSPLEIRSWTESLRCSEGQLRAAVAAVGTSARDVRDYLQRQAPR